MKLLFYVIVIVLFSVPSFGTDYECSGQCIVAVDSKTQQPTGDLNCTLPSKNANMIIISQDVFEADGPTLKTYFENKETVCDVLGWMNDGAEYFKDVNGLIEEYKRNKNICKQI